MTSIEFAIARTNPRSTLPASTAVEQRRDRAVQDVLGSSEIRLRLERCS
jgi:hypothetical protein